MRKLLSTLAVAAASLAYISLANRSLEAQPQINQLTLASITQPDGTPLLPKKTKLMRVDNQTTGVVIELSAEAVERPWRPADVKALLVGLQQAAGLPPSAELVVVVGRRRLEDYVPPYWREKRIPRCGPSQALQAPAAPLRVVARPAGAPGITNGLAGRHLVISASHGLYYDKDTGRWMWQRPRMFTTVEDKLTMSVVNDYLIPMLERAGATVISCRERDPQVHEVVVDDEEIKSSPAGTFESNGFSLIGRRGFGKTMENYPEGVNPHTLGKTQEALQPASGAFARWTPRIPETGEYAVYVSYAADKNRSAKAHYRVRYFGGVQDIFINQQMAGNLWVYLGTFRFAQGLSPATGSVELLADGSAPGSLSADAVKFGGGMGNVLRDGKSSGYPRYLEAGRYWFQYAGADPGLVYAFGKHAGQDYTEDYVGRGEFINYLVGAPCGPNSNRSAEGKRVPVDAALSLHTDASISTSTVGTLAIYRLTDETKTELFPDGRDRMLNRDLADLVQTQIVEDIRASFCSTWNRRELANRDYAEARRPNVPCVLIEALSHQNYDDIKFALDPRFRELWARAIYKGMLKFLATEYGYKPVVAPLPPRLVAARLDGAHVRLEWEAVTDPLEPTAVPTGYIVYRRVGASGFDSGTYVGNVTSVTLPLAVNNPVAVESFCVAAVNTGGESAPSDCYSVSLGQGSRVLIVHGFDRICGPAVVACQGATPDSLGASCFEGVVRHRDRGVADSVNTPLTGEQFDFDRGHPWVGEDSPYTNDHPGHGASLGDLETSQELGRRRDLAYFHADTFASLGFGVDTVNARDAARLPIDATAQSYVVIDFLMGEQRTTLPPPPHHPQGGAADRREPEFEVWPIALREWLKSLAQQRTTILVSGSYVLTDPVIGPKANAETRAFVKDVLRAKWTSERASTSNEVARVAGPLRFRLSSGLGENGVYGVESPGGVAAAHKSGTVILRYADTGVGAAVSDASGPARVIVLGFPLECVVGEASRRALLEELLR